MIEFINFSSREVESIREYGEILSGREFNYLEQKFKWGIYCPINLHSIRKDDGWYHNFWQQVLKECKMIRYSKIQEVMTCIAVANTNSLEYIYDHNEDFILELLELVKIKQGVIYRDNIYYIKGDIGEFLKAGSYDRKRLLREKKYSDKFLTFVSENEIKG
jgi:hypothetical protein